MLGLISKKKLLKTLEELGRLANPNEAIARALDKSIEEVFFRTVK